MAYAWFNLSAYISYMASSPPICLKQVDIIQCQIRLVGRSNIGYFDIGETKESVGDTDTYQYILIINLFINTSRQKVFIFIQQKLPF